MTYDQFTMAPTLINLRHRAVAATVVINGYVLLAEWIIAPLHARGILQPIFGFIDGLAAMLGFPGLVMVICTGGRSGHMTTTPQWFILFGFNMVFWWMIAAFVLWLMFG